MNTPTTALNAEYERVIVARFVTKRDGTAMHCVTCNAVLVQGTALAAVNSQKQWHSYCPACAADFAVQIRGLYSRLLEMGVSIPTSASDAVRAFLADENRGTFLDAKRVLMTVRSDAGREARAEVVHANGLDLSNVPSGRYAVPGGDTRLKVKIDNVSKGKWAGWVFVKDAAEYGEGKRYGNQKPGQMYRGQIEDALRAIAGDIAGAAAAWGHLTGTCTFCGLPLEDVRSVAVGYGPTCATNHGLPWG